MLCEQDFFQMAWDVDSWLVKFNSWTGKGVGVKGRLPLVL
jgi:hypothetical protein